MIKKMSDFAGLYKLFQTLKFELRPIGATAENLDKSGLLEQDFKRANDYPAVKYFLDEQHKKFLAKVFSGIETVDWTGLAEELEKFQNDHSRRKELEKAQDKVRKDLVNIIKKDAFYKTLTESTPSKLFKHIMNNEPDVIAEVKTFERFACYFKGYQENRENIYSADKQQTAAAYRAVHDNFTKFHAITRIFSGCISGHFDLMHDIISRTANLRKGEELAEIFTVANYNHYLSQKGIEFINALIAEMNYSINQYRQQHKEISSKDLPFLPMLFKQILNDREGAFSVPAFANDRELCSALKDYLVSNNEVVIHSEKVDLFTSLQRLFFTINNESDLFVTEAGLSNISSALTGSWSSFKDAAAEYAETIFARKNDREKYLKKDVYSFEEISKWNICRNQEDGKIIPVQLAEYWHSEKVADLFKQENELRSVVLAIIEKETEVSLRERKDDIVAIKSYLDTVQELLHTLKPLCVGAEYGGDQDLLGIITEHFQALETVIPLYNQCRNYATKKLSDEVPKIKLMFNTATLADGWDYNKEAANKSILLMKDGKYFLGIIAPKAKIDFEKISCQATEDCYKKMVYKQMGDPSKDLPNLMRIGGNVVRKTGRKNDNGENKILEELRNKHLPAHINRIRKEQTFSVNNEKFSREDLNSYIDFYKEMIVEYRSDSIFHFKPSSDYANFADFAKDLNQQAYQILFTNISTSAIDEAVKKGELYLFQIWNKDFAQGATGKPNKATMFWKALFDEQNLNDVVFKLNGEAELFLREPAIKKVEVTHKVGEKVVNRTIVREIRDNIAIREAIDTKLHDEIYRYVNGKLDMPLSRKAENLLNNRLDWKAGMTLEDTVDKVVVKTVTHDLIKDKRYTERKFFFHVPYAINFKSQDTPKKMNEQVLDFLRNNPDVNIIGIDRGERHLIYLTLIDRTGRITQHPKSFNIVNGVDYHAKLKSREEERLDARRSWNEIGKIKDLKEGYLSGVIQEIVSLMVKHNAILVMEDLNDGFKRGRTKFEKQVYQKFEKMLINKLNYLTFKDVADPKAPGGVLNGYQLANKFESFSKMGKQNGFIFYVPAAYTSKIDPTTGFTNLFNTKKCTNAVNRKAFFEDFDSICFDAERNAFAFSFDYNNFKTGQTSWKTDWTVYSAEKRLVFNTKTKHSEEIFPTKNILCALNKIGVQVTDGFDLKAFLKNIDPDSKAGATFFSELFFAFDRTLQMRNSLSGTAEDYIQSPVLNSSGEFYNSKTASADLPQDADANGAYHIALKGLYLLTEVIDKGSSKVDRIEHANWLKFAQSRHK